MYAQMKGEVTDRKKIDGGGIQRWNVRQERNNMDGRKGPGQCQESEISRTGRDRFQRRQNIGEIQLAAHGT